MSEYGERVEACRKLYGGVEEYDCVDMDGWIAEVAALEEQLLERQAECFVLGDELAGVRKWAKAWKRVAKFWHGWKREEDEYWFGVIDERDAYKALADFRKRERDSARRVARALNRVVEAYDVEHFRVYAVAAAKANARHVLAREARRD